MTRTYLVAASAVIGLLLSAQAQAQSDLTPFQEKVEAAMALDLRSAEHRARDANRDPVRALPFCRMSEDMTVIEFGPGAGWYTEILGPVLKDTGHLTIAYKGSWMERLDERLALEPLSQVEKLPIDIDWNKQKRKFDVGELSFGRDDADLVLNIREYHNFDPEGARKLNNAVFAALKPGGLYCIIDHTRRHMEPDSPENRRRADPVQVIKQVQAAGFMLLDSSDLFFRPDDELRYEVGRKTVTGNTDRFSLLFRKPLP